MSLSVVPEAPPRRRVTGPVTAEHGLTWSVYRVVDDFEVEVSRGDPVIYTDPTLYSTAHKAERAARAWCEAHVPTSGADPDTDVGQPQPAPPRATTGRNLGPMVRTMEAGGWLIEICEDGRGSFVALAIDVDNGEASDEDLGSFETCDLADEAARAWTRKHPTRGEQERERTSREMDAAMGGDPLTPFDEPVQERPADQAPVADVAPAVTRDEEMEQLRRERDQARRERDAAYATAAADFLEATAEAEELLELAEKKQHWLGVIEDAKLELKLIEKKLGGKADSVARRIQGIGRGERGQAYQQRLFANSAETREVVGGEARKVVERLSRPESILDTAKAAGMEIASHAWPYNGVEHHIEHEATSNAMGHCITAWIRGHRQYTEGHGETYEQAVESCKSAAAIYFADCEPGQTKPSEDAGAVADGPRKPAKRGKAAKLNGHDQVFVAMVVGRTADTVAASIELGCSPFQLKKYAEKQGLALKLPAPPAAKAGKPRGRKPKGGAK